ncbi:MAG: tyrosine-type recombinase/integrase [Burkholderiales bacterium]
MGRLMFRARATGQGMFYFRYTNPTSGRQDSEPIGAYDPKGAAGLTLKDARAKQGEYSRLYQGGARDLRAHLEHERAEQAARIERAAKDRHEAQRQATAGTLRKLLEGYIAHLERQGKQSAQDARNIIKRNVLDEFPDLAATRAADITHRDVSAILAKLIDRGVGRTAGKARAYLRAAFAGALAAESDPTIHPDLHGFALAANPAAVVPAGMLSRFNRARERVLNVPELHAFLGALEKREGVARDAILLGLYLGGQRITQLVRLRPADVDLDGRSLTLYDTKGARKQPRAHRLPITDRAAEILERLMKANGEAPVLMSTNGKVPIRTETIADTVTEICTAMMANKTARERFEHRDLRRTCETMLASIGISRDVRAQLQSHGLGGIQQRHYDRHDYMDEKRRALEVWDARLAEIASGKTPEKVVPIAAGKKAKRGAR